MPFRKDLSEKDIKELTQWGYHCRECDEFGSDKPCEECDGEGCNYCEDGEGYALVECDYCGAEWYFYDQEGEKVGEYDLYDLEKKT